MVKQLFMTLTRNYNREYGFLPTEIVDGLSASLWNGFDSLLIGVLLLQPWYSALIDKNWKIVVSIITCFAKHHELLLVYTSNLSFYIAPTATPFPWSMSSFSTFLNTGSYAHIATFISCPRSPFCFR
jgi:hypothetical protein